MARRNDMDICRDILKVAKLGARKTQIVYQANLNFYIVKKYLERLTRGGLIEYREDIRKYFTTEPGNWFIDQYSDLVDIMSETPPQMG
jgi:predicted transcriptional regulator